MPALDRKCALENESLVLAVGMLVVQDIVLQLFDRYDSLLEVGQQFHSRNAGSITGRTLPCQNHVILSRTKRTRTALCFQAAASRGGSRFLSSLGIPRGTKS